MQAYMITETAYEDRVYTEETVQILRKQIEESIQHRILYDIVKRIFDIFFSITALIVLAPLFIGLALYVFICDPHDSPIYCAERCGKNGKTFRFYKFRTMYKDADQKIEEVACLNEMDGPVFKASNDPRIIPGLRVLRETSLDELLQFIHVLTGHMSVVGPRPPLPREAKRYCAYEQLRIAIKPGLTCYWQVMPNRNSCSFEEWLELDIRYILERNILLDLKLIFKTICVMMNREGR